MAAKKAAPARQLSYSDDDVRDAVRATDYALARLKNFQAMHKVGALSGSTPRAYIRDTLDALRTLEQAFERLRQEPASLPLSPPETSRIVAYFKQKEEEHFRHVQSRERDEYREFQDWPLSDSCLPSSVGAPKLGVPLSHNHSKSPMYRLEKATEAFLEVHRSIVNELAPQPSRDLVHAITLAEPLSAIVDTLVMRCIQSLGMPQVEMDADCNLPRYRLPESARLLIASRYAFQHELRAIASPSSVAELERVAVYKRAADLLDASGDGAQRFRLAHAWMVKVIHDFGRHLGTYQPNGHNLARLDNAFRSLTYERMEPVLIDAARTFTVPPRKLGRSGLSVSRALARLASWCGAFADKKTKMNTQREEEDRICSAIDEALKPSRAKRRKK
jgi:hypothetical protein